MGVAIFSLDGKTEIQHDPHQRSTSSASEYHWGDCITQIAGDVQVTTLSAILLQRSFRTDLEILDSTSVAVVDPVVPVGPGAGRRGDQQAGGVALSQFVGARRERRNPIGASAWLEARDHCLSRLRCSVSWHFLAVDVPYISTSIIPNSTDC